MTTILLIVHMLIALTLVGVILLQRSEGGALGIGGGGFGGLMTGRSSANLLTRTTAVLAAGFIATSLLLAIVATLVDRSIVSYTVIVAGFAAGSLAGAVLALVAVVLRVDAKRRAWRRRQRESQRWQRRQRREPTVAVVPARLSVESPLAGGRRRPIGVSAAVASEMAVALRQRR